MMKTCSTLLRAVTAFLLLQLSASAVTVNLNPTADTFVTAGSGDVNAGSPGANYGGAGALMISGASTTKGEIQTLFKFNLATAKTMFDTTFGAGNWLVDSITLQLGTNTGTQGVQPMNLIFNTINQGLFNVDWLANDNWGEGNGTPMTPFLPTNPPVDGATYNSLGVLESGADETLGTFTYTPVGNTNPPTIPAANYALGLDSSFIADISAGGDVSLRAYADDATVGYLFNARSFGSNKPTLIVSASVVPEPGAGALLAAMALLWLARRRHDARAA
jgi:hypothetical protein